jgi:hypothetical protein
VLDIVKKDTRAWRVPCYSLFTRKKKERRIWKGVRMIRDIRRIGRRRRG